MHGGGLGACLGCHARVIRAMRCVGRTEMLIPELAEQKASLGAQRGATRREGADWLFRAAAMAEDAGAPYRGHGGLIARSGAQTGCSRPCGGRGELHMLVA